MNEALICYLLLLLLILQLKLNKHISQQFFIMKLNQIVQNIINHIILRSRKASQEILQTQPKHNKSTTRHYQQDDQLQEYIIQKRDLRQTIQKLADQHFNKQELIDKLNEDITELKMEIKQQKQLTAALAHNNNSNGESSAYKEHLIKQYVADLAAQRKISQQLEEDHKWMRERVKKQLNEIQELRQNLASKEEIISKLNAKDADKDEPTDERYKFIRPNQQYFTPKRQSYKKIQLPAFIIDSMEQNFLTDTLTKPICFCNPTMKHFQTQGTKQHQRDLMTQSLKIHPEKNLKEGLTESQLSMNREKRKLQLEIDKKDRALKLLGIKCMNLQFYIENLTKRFLGQNNTLAKSKNQQLSETKFHQNTFGIQQIEQEEKISEIYSQCENSNTFRIDTSEI